MINFKITEERAPKPNLNLHTKIKTCTQHFNTSLYEVIPRLCGCDELNKLFCRPCPLFSEAKHVFNNAGYNDINSIYKSDKRHRHSVNHIAYLKKSTLFGKNSGIEFSLSSQYKQSNEKHNEAVKQDRKSLHCPQLDHHDADGLAGHKTWRTAQTTTKIF
jgi:hypothetical protein